MRRCADQDCGENRRPFDRADLERHHSGSRQANRSGEARFLALLLVSFALAPCFGQESPATKNVLIMMMDVSARAGFTDAFESSLRARYHGDLSFYEAFLYESPALTKTNLASEAEELRARFANTKLDLVIAVHPETLDFMIQYHDQIFPGVPIVYCGVGTRIYGGKKWPGMTGFTSPQPFGETIDFALRLQPDTQAIAVLAGEPTDPTWLGSTRSDLRRYNGKIKEIDVLDPAGPEVLKRVEALPPRTIVLFNILVYRKGEATLRGYDLLEAVSKLRPTYSAFETLCLNHGCIGGEYEDRSKLADSVADTAARILSGESPDDIPVVRTTALQAQVDWQAFKYWKLDKRNLPPGTVLLNKPPSLWESYEDYILVVLAVILVQALLIGGLLFQRRMKRETENRLRAIFHSSQDAIINVDEQQSIASFNQSALRMFGYSGAEMMGQKLDRLVPEAARARHAGLVAAFGRSNIANRTMRAPTLVLTCLHADGSTFLSEISISHTMVGGRRLFSAFIRDITERNRAEIKLRDSEERYRATFEQAAIGIVHSSFEGQVLRCNKRFAEFLGYSAEEVAGMSVEQFTPVEYLARTNELLQEFAGGRKGGSGLETPYIRKDGTLRWGRLTASVQREGKGQPLHMVSFVEDISARKAAEENLAVAAKELEGSEVRHRTVFQTSLDALSISRLSDGKIVDVNKRFLDLIGFQREEVIGRTTVELGIWANPSQRPGIVEELRRNSSIRDLEVLFRRKDGSTFWGLTSTAVVELDDAPHVVLAARDISDVKEAVKTIRDLAFYDPLTHLPNRRSLLDFLEQTRRVETRARALLFVDLDNFKSLNDALGHRAGDLLLREAAERLAACVRGEGTVARLGGDEFAIVLENLDNASERAAEQARQVGEEILAEGRRPYLVGEHESHFSFSIGITVFGTDLESGLEALQQGEIAMSKAKEAGRNTLRFFSPELQANVNARVLLENELRKAIKTEEFELYFQPQLRAGRLIGSEALVRWNHPQNGVLAPSAFIELAEDCGLILPLGNWVLWNACEHVAGWAGKNPSGDTPVAVNISGKQFGQDDFVERVLTTLDLTGANAASISLEITETSLVKDFQDAVAKMTELKSHGLKFSIDDFGTGYSSLAYLKSLPIDQLKIDRAFVDDILVDGASGAIAQAIISLGHSMGFSVIAEGVETEEQRDFLLRLGCDSFQGFLFGCPLSADEFERNWFL